MCPLWSIRYECDIPVDIAICSYFTMVTLGRFICRQYEFTTQIIGVTLSAYSGFAVFRFRNKHEGGGSARRKDKVVQRSLEYHVVYTNPGFPS